MKNTLILLILAITLFSCKKTETKIETKTVETILDTVVKIEPLNPIENKDSISTETATKTLYAHFKSKGFLTQDEIEKTPNIRWLPQNKGKNVIEFSELFLFNNQLGIITYYNAAIGATGHCVQPHNAIISNSGDGFAISNEDFLPTNFGIDSVATHAKKTIIYAIDYNCIQHKIINKYKIELK